jgi:hypothetical protein
MPTGLSYALGVLSGMALFTFTRKCIIKAERVARKEAYKDYQEKQHLRTEAFNRGYECARKDYSNITEVERFVDTFKGRNVKLRYKEVN